MLTRLNEPALAALAEGYRAEFLSGAGPAALLDRRSLAPLRRRVALDAYEDRAVFLSPAGRNLAPPRRRVVYEARASCHMFSWTSTWTLQSTTRRGWRSCPRSSRFGSSAAPSPWSLPLRARASSELHVVGIHAISTPTRLRSWHDDLLAEAEALGPGAFDGLTLTFSPDIANQDRWRALGFNARAPQ